MSQFSLLSQEHGFARSGAKPDATARLSIGGKARNFLLRLHEGLIYFKEPSRAPVFAITETFDSSLARDAIGLISRFGSEVAQSNYGALVSKRDYFPGLPVRAQISLILRPDGTGWMREHFDDDWFMLPDDKAAPLDVWNDQDTEAAMRARLPFAQRSLLNRAISPEWRQRETPVWQGEASETITRLLIAAARTWIAPSAPWNDEEWRLLKFKSHSAFSRGDIEGRWLKHALLSPQFAAFWEVLEPQIQFVGVRWSEGGEQLEQYARTRNEKIFQAGLEKWGRDWRGNWAPQRASYPVQLPDTSNPTAHERMEAALLLREWLAPKMGEKALESLFMP